MMKLSNMARVRHLMDRYEGLLQRHVACREATSLCVTAQSGISPQWTEVVFLRDTAAPFMAMAKEAALGAIRDQITAVEKEFESLGVNPKE